MAATTDKRKVKALSGWDNGSGVRERLALLAHFGPSVEPINWGYHSSRDFWYYCGPAGPRPQVKVSSEGEASACLEHIVDRFGIGRVDAMALIGHPVK